MTSDELRAKQLAQRFHETYERLAPSFGYETRRDSAVPWTDVPEENRALMIAVCAEIAKEAEAALAEARQEGYKQGQSDLVHSSSKSEIALEAALAECERKKTELQRKLSSALHQWHDSKNKLIAIREFDIATTTSYQRAEDSALESAVDYRRGMIYAAELYAALTEAGEQEKNDGI